MKKSSSRWVPQELKTPPTGPYPHVERWFCPRWVAPTLPGIYVGNALAQRPPGSLPVAVSASGFSGFIAARRLESLAVTRLRWWPTAVRVSEEAVGVQVSWGTPRSSDAGLVAADPPRARCGAGRGWRVRPWLTSLNPGLLSASVGPPEASSICQHRVLTLSRQLRAGQLWSWTAPRVRRPGGQPGPLRRRDRDPSHMPRSQGGTVGAAGAQHTGTPCACA